MSRRYLYLAMLSSFLGWIAVAEMFDGNWFLALNTIAGAILIAGSPWLYVMRDEPDPEASPNAGVGTPLPPTSILADAFPARVGTTLLER